MNGLFVLRLASDNLATSFYNFYYNLSQNYQQTFLIILVISILLINLSQGILIPIVFKVHKTNNQVLSLFGGIPIHEIKELAFKCEKYMQSFLEERQD